jgi:hypothetical protein
MGHWTWEGTHYKGWFVLCFGVNLAWAVLLVAGRFRQQSWMIITLVAALLFSTAHIVMERRYKNQHKDDWREQFRE